MRSNRRNTQDSPVVSPNNFRVLVIGSGTDAISDLQPHSPEEGQSITNFVEGVSQASLGTTQKGRPRRRIQWTQDMNE